VVGNQTQSPTAGALGKVLYTARFYSLARTLQKWRLDPELREMEGQKTKGRVLPFVKGLRLSAQVAYIARDILSGQNVEVNWGHLVDDSYKLCSPECDIIIHHRGCIERWNGHTEPIMDFRFVECSKAIAVISCKSFAKGIDKGYCKALAEYGVRNVLLFAECCEAERVEALTKNAAAAGYAGFFYLYSVAGDGFSVREDETVYIDFVNMLKNLASGPGVGTPKRAIEG
jgi:hypothetical protein